MFATPNFTERLPERATHWGRRIGLGVMVGIFAGLAAIAIDWMIEFGTHHLIGQHAAFETGQLLDFNIVILLLPAAGGLIAGIVVHLLCRDVGGHGVDALTRAFHFNLGRMGLGGPAVKGAGSTLVIATGGSAGPEGPIAALGAAIGSTIGRFFPVTPQERRILLVAGCAAGIGAIFRCPLGGALFATSILYSEPEFESDSIVASFVASVIGYSTFMAVGGFEGPMLDGVAAFQFTSARDLAWYALLGPLCGLTSIFFYFCMMWVERGLVPKSKLPRWLLPGLGGLGTGAIACMIPQVMDGQFIFIQHAIDGALMSEKSWQAWALLFALVVLGKCLATALTVGSGAPGGVLGPAVFIGGAVGALLGMVGEGLFPGAMPEELRRALIPVGMAGVLAATMRIPLASIVMITEMTGSYGLIAPLMLVCVTSYIVGKRWGLNTEQVRTAADSPAHVADPIIHLLETWRVSELMETIWPLTVRPDARLDELIARIEPGTRPVIAVSEHGELNGVISAADLGRVMDQENVASLLVASDLMTTELVTLDRNQDVYSALTTFARVDHDVLPVMTGRSPKRWVGMLPRRRIVERLHEELERSHVSAFEEHVALSAIEQDLQIDQLLMSVPAKHAKIQRLFIPIPAIGKSLRECDFRRQYNAQVIAVEQRDGSIQCPPDLDAPLRTEQRLLAVIWTPPADDEEET